MEKLQVALEKARDMRSGVKAPAATPDQPRSPAQTGQQPAQQAAQAAAPEIPGMAETWAALRGFSPDEAWLRKKRVVGFKGGADATSFDVLRTKVLQMMTINGWKRLAITSPGSDTGKSTLTANLAASISRRPEITAVLFDMDMRRPSLGSILGLSGPAADTVGTAAMLEGKIAFADQARRIGENLVVSVNTKVARHPAEILHSHQSAEVLDAIQATYTPTIMIFDMPPLLMGDDTLGFMSQVDCALLIAESGVSTIDQIDQCERALSERTNVLGVVLNKSRFTEEEYGYGYGYGHY